MFYRTDLFARAGITMPGKPTWQQVYDFAVKLKGMERLLRYRAAGAAGMGGDPCSVQYGGQRVRRAMVRRGLEPGLRRACHEPRRGDSTRGCLSTRGEPNPTTDGYTECLAIMQSGKAAMWYDATVSAGALEARDSKVAGRIGYALAPSARKGNTGWLWAWALGIESSSKHPAEAFRFITWATDRKYVSLVGGRIGWAQVPPGDKGLHVQQPPLPRGGPVCRRSSSIPSRAPTTSRPTSLPVPYKGIQYVSIPEFQSLGEAVSQQLAAYIAGQKSLPARWRIPRRRR